MHQCTNFNFEDRCKLCGKKRGNTSKYIMPNTEITNSLLEINNTLKLISDKLYSIASWMFCIYLILIIIQVTLMFK